MREILFRGKDEDSGFWCYGDLSYGKDGKPYIGFWGHNGYLVRCVLPETVGQFIVMTDKNNKKIFEGDIVFDGYKKTVAYVAYLQQECGFVLVYQSYDSRMGHRHRGCFYDQDILLEVIGNIYDNPELLEVK